MHYRRILNEYGLIPKRKLGQNFLFSKSCLAKIVDSADIKRTDVILEIGPGIGNLTELMVDSASALIGIEKDRSLFKVLKNRLKDKPNLILINEDFLNVDLNSYASKFGSLKIVANPPYYISSLIIDSLIRHRRSLAQVFLSFQKEYIDKIFAVPGSKDYGIISVITQAYFEVKKLFKIPKNFFYPSPKFDSYFIVLLAKKLPGIDNDALFLSLVREFFKSRRKTVKRIIKNSKIISVPDPAEALYNLNIGLNSRPENITVSEYIEIANYYCRSIGERDASGTI
ncbi:MAG: 16S rRNA (adenine(1518)-N(6)/adenine(1519)-N(6))-dimethyltransferase RsmA [Candidatus Omnitrophica bacterium]|nr:16S rRNA (adenine(1518)-N(6)/adenine(1519)-N(6))-dimethyltransferase RsmA [Candidatus Omnitrophota bacterium]